MRWTKKGRIFGPAGVHAQGPTVLSYGNVLRIYFATRPQPDISVPIYIDVDANDPARIVGINETPLLELGSRGSFDEFGIQPTEVFEHEGEIWLFYTGWDRGTTVTYRLAIGLAKSQDGGKTFKKAYQGPVVDRTRDEPFLTTSPSILREEGRWHMWYGSGIGYHEAGGGGKDEPQYIIKYATSLNGIDWQRPNLPCLEPKSELESNTRPTVAKIDGVYHMWFTYRGAQDYRGGKNSYRIGYASSSDRVRWKRDDDLAGISPSEEGWDSAMITYPYVVRLKDRYLMFYNGNGFGASGFGYAIGE
jgi:predicted GH43/DUF377 family glycosyl hydrolase